jgi:hypothetical protein
MIDNEVEFVAHLEARNEMPRQRQNPLIEVQKELHRFQQDQIDRAYCTFHNTMVRPHTRHLKTVKPSGWSEAQGLRSQYLCIENELKPEIDRLWAEKLQDGTWTEWIDGEPAPVSGFPLGIRRLDRDPTSE